MASTYSIISSSTYDGRKMKLECKQAMDIATNTSTITWTLTTYGGNVNDYATGPTTVKINNTQVYYKARTSHTANVFPARAGSTSGTIKVSHVADGSLSIPISLSTAIYYGSSSVKTDSGTWTLDKIPRQATVTAAPNFNDEANPTITYSNPAGNNVTSLQACISLTGSAADIAYRDISKTGTSYTFNLTDAERSVLRTNTTGSNSRTVKFYVKTVIGGNTFYSSVSKTFSIVNGTPVINPTVVDTNNATIALTGDANTLVRYYSNARATLAYELKKEATLSSSTITHNGRSTSQHAYTFNAVENGTFEFSLTDSRKNTVSKTITKNFVNYVRLTCNMGNETPTTSGAFDFTVSGNYFNGSFGAVANTLTVQYRYKTQDGDYGSWSNMTVTKSGNTYTASASLTGLDYRETYVFQAKAVDKLLTTTTEERATKATPVFSWNDEVFEFNVPVNFMAGVSGATATVEDDGAGNAITGDFSVTGDLRLKNSGNYGNTLFFGDGSYCYIKEASDDAMTIKGTRINLEANGVYVYGNPLPAITTGTWTPTLNSSAVSSYTVQYGWYSKVGQTVTIGFQIKASINSGYSSTALTIGGCPFTPMFMASGGGIAHNINIAAGFCFEGWVVNDSGVISARLQPSNNTAAGNLNISSTSSYPTGSGTVVTLAGTICFMANS